MGLGVLTKRTNTYGLHGKKLRMTITATAVAGFSLFGYDQGLMSGLIAAEQFNWEFPATRDNGTIQGAVTASYEIGCFFGALFALMKGERTGRRPLIFVGSILIIIGAIISTTPFRPHWPLGHFVVGRVITGLGNGLNTATIPVWQSEMSRAENRGFLVNMEGAFIAVGTFIAYWTDFGFSFIDSSVQWRFPVAFQIFFALLVLIGIWGCPESPRWLIKNNHEDEARYILGKLKGVKANDKEVQEEISGMIESINKFSRVQGGIREIFTGGKTQHFRRMIIGCSGQFFQQLTGCNAAIYYSTLLFYQTIFNGTQYRLSMILGGVFATIYALSTIPSFFLIDTLGRRKLFLIGAAGQGISFTISFACLINPTPENAKGAAVGIFLFIIFFAFTLLPLPWLYPPELNPLKTRTYASAASTCTNWLMNFAVVMFVPKFLETSGWGTYLFFAAVNFCYIPIIYYFYVETKGRSLEEIDIIFAKAYVEKKPAWVIANTMPKLSLTEIDEEATKLGLHDDSDDEEIDHENIIGSDGDGYGYADDENFEKSNFESGDLSETDSNTNSNINSNTNSNENNNEK